MRILTLGTLQFLTGLWKGHLKYRVLFVVRSSFSLRGRQDLVCSLELGFNDCVWERKTFPRYRLLAVSLSCANLIDAKRDETLKACLLDISLEFYAKATNTSIQQKAPHFDDTRSIVDDHHLLLSWLGDRLREDASIKPGVESEGHTSSIFELAARRIRSLSQDAMHSYFFSMYQVRVFAREILNHPGVTLLKSREFWTGTSDMRISTLCADPLDTGRPR